MIWSVQSGMFNRFMDRFWILSITSDLLQGLICFKDTRYYFLPQIISQPCSSWLFFHRFRRGEHAYNLPNVCRRYPERMEKEDNLQKLLEILVLRQSTEI